MSQPEKVDITNFPNIVGIILGINPQRREMIPLEITQFANKEAFWIVKRIGRR